MECHREKALNYWNVFHFVGKDSFKTPPVAETSHMMYGSGVILAHSSTESSNLDGSVGLFCELFRSLVLTFYWI